MPRPTGGTQGVEKALSDEGTCLHVALVPRSVSSLINLLWHLGQKLLLQLLALSFFLCRVFFERNGP